MKESASFINWIFVNRLNICLRGVLLFDFKRNQKRHKVGKVLDFLG